MKRAKTRASGVLKASRNRAGGPAEGRPGHIYRVVEIVGSSEVSIEDAIEIAVDRAEKTLRHLRWFEVVRTTGHIENGKVGHYQVTLKVGFTMEKPT